MLTEKDYCDYDTCVALKELGYKVPTSAYYMPHHKDLIWVSNPFRGGYVIDCFYSHNSLSKDVMTANFIDAPTLWEAQKWLRKEKDIHIEVYACAGGYIYELCKAYKPNSFSGGTTIYTPNDVDNKLNDAGRYDDFETCLFEGIKEAVKILKENGKDYQV